MILQKCLVLLAFANIAVGFSRELVPAKRTPEARALQFLTDSIDLMQRNPKNSMACFPYYAPKLTEIMETYEKNNEICTNDAKEARSAVDQKTTDQRNGLAANSNSACNAVSQCEEESSTEKVFQCYVNSGTDSSTVLKKVSQDAQVNLAAYQRSIQNIESTEKICLIENKIQYEKDWNDIYDELNDCVNGLIPVPTDTPSSF